MQLHRVAKWGSKVNILNENIGVSKILRKISRNPVNNCDFC
jgi:hypothetical protein